MLFPHIPAAIRCAQSPQRMFSALGTTRTRRQDCVMREEQSPPPYSSRAFHQQQRSQFAATSGAQQQPPPYAPRRSEDRRIPPRSPTSARQTNLRKSNPRVERLRRFLSFSLAIDYGLQNATPDRLSASDWAHFVRLARQMAEACSAANEDLSDSHLTEDIMTPPIRYQVREPAIALGVDPQTVLVQLRLFISSIHRCKGGGGYSSQLERMPVDQDMREFGRKLLHDRMELIETVLPKNPKAMCPYRALQTQMMVRNQTIIDQWFVRLDGSNCDPREMRSPLNAKNAPFPLRTFEKETKNVIALLRLLQSSPSDIPCWKRWIYHAAKRREDSLYLAEDDECNYFARSAREVMI